MLTCSSGVVQTNTHSHTNGTAKGHFEMQTGVEPRPSRKWPTRSTSWTKAGPYEGDTLTWSHFVKLFMRNRKTIWKNTFIWITHCSGKHAFVTHMHSPCGLRLHVLFTTISPFLFLFFCSSKKNYLTWLRVMSLLICWLFLLFNCSSILQPKPGTHFNFCVIFQLLLGVS